MALVPGTFLRVQATATPPASATMAAAALAMPLAHSTSVCAVFQAWCSCAAVPSATSKGPPAASTVPDTASSRTCAPASASRRAASSVAQATMGARALNASRAGAAPMARLSVVRSPQGTSSCSRRISSPSSRGHRHGLHLASS